MRNTRFVYVYAYAYAYEYVYVYGCSGLTLPCVDGVQSGGMRWGSVIGLRVVLLALCSAALAGCDCALSINTSTLPDGVVGMSYAFNLDSDCGGDTWFIATGSELPPGINLQSDGDLRGMPTREGDFQFTVGVFDFGSGDTAFAGLQLRVRRVPPPTATP